MELRQMTLAWFTSLMHVTVQPITAEAFAPFGQVIAAPALPGRQSFAAGLTHDERPPVLSTSHVAAAGLPLTVSRLERHPNSSQTFLPLEVAEWLVVVSTTPKPQDVRAFIVGPSTGVTIARGVWHAGLTALEQPGRFAVMMWKDGVTDDEFVDVDPIEIRPASLSAEPPRDLVGYAGNPPKADWPGGARLAINFVLNLAEGSQPSIGDGDGYSENRLTDSSIATGDIRDLASEGLFEYGSRAGFWRVHRALQERGVPATMFACAVALERNPQITEAIVDAGYDVCSHGYRWVNHRTMSEHDERHQIALAVQSFRSTIGSQPAGWYCRYGPSVNTRRLLVEHGGFLYDSDAYNDDLPYWTDVGVASHLVVPYSLTTNDAKLFDMSPRDWAEYIGDAIDLLRREGADRAAMLSIGLHPRIVGQAARFAGLARVLDRVSGLTDVWVASRRAIAEHWARTHPVPG